MNDPLINRVYQPIIDLTRIDPKRAARECLRGFVILVLVSLTIDYAMHPDFWRLMPVLFGSGVATTYLRREQLRHPADNWRLMLFRYFFLMVAFLDGQNVIGGWISGQSRYSVVGGFAGDIAMLSYASMMFFDWCRPPPPPREQYNLQSSTA